MYHETNDYDNVHICVYASVFWTPNKLNQNYK